MMKINRVIEVVKGNIVEQEVDAIVNAAHEGLTGGGGVDGAIHAAAGQTMTGECMNLNIDRNGERCPIGECRMTSGYDLKAKYILHTVGPVWRGGDMNEAWQLHCAYTSCLDMADMQGLKSIAFPCISTGAFCFPKQLAAQIAFKACREWYENFGELKGTSIEDIRFVCFDDENYEIYKSIMPSGCYKEDFVIEE
jgi:O-acetyl-ADP-ribose deacetylase (regulator of RNase III)